MYGVVEGAFHCNNERTNELNNRIASRNFSTPTLYQSIRNRPVSTRFLELSIEKQSDNALTNVGDSTRPNSMPIEDIFVPGNSFGPWVGYARNVEKETQLIQGTSKNGGEESIYIPSSHSDLFEVVLGNSNKISEGEQRHKSLFMKPILGNFNPNEIGLGGRIFSNCTRQQLKNI